MRGGLLIFLQRHVAGNTYVKNYEFNFNFGQPWGQCDVTMTSVLGHLNELEFTEAHRKWYSCAPAQLFDAPTIEFVKDQVCKLSTPSDRFSYASRIKLSQPISHNKHVFRRLYSSGLIAIVKGNISEPRLERQLCKAIKASKLNGLSSAILRGPILSMPHSDRSTSMTDWQMLLQQEWKSTCDWAPFSHVSRR